MSDVSGALKLVADELADAKAPCVTSSFQAECVVLVHMLRELAPGIPVLFLDTVHHFPQTIAYRDELASRWGLNLVMLRAAEPAPDCGSRTQSLLRENKVEPLFGALASYDVWFTGLRRAQSASRAALEEVERSSCRAGRSWQGEPPSPAGPPRRSGPTRRRTTSHCCHSNLGYTSVGCEPCTSLPVDRATTVRPLAGTEARVRDSYSGGSIKRRGPSEARSRERERAGGGPRER